MDCQVDVPMALYGSIPMVTCVHGGPQPHASGFLALNPSEGFVQAGLGVSSCAGFDKKNRAKHAIQVGKKAE